MALRLVAAICGAGILLLNLPDVMTENAGARSYSSRVFTRQPIMPVTMGSAIEGTASMYNPFRLGEREGGTETASGEPYDPAAWTAAIQRGLRDRFGGVHFGKAYRRTYALVESGGKAAVLKINDVGPLKSGRVIDLNEQAMRYFDPTLRLGLIDNVLVTPLLGDGWTAGPVEGDLLLRMTRRSRAA